MTPAEHLKHLHEALIDVDFYVDTEIVGEDARHICEDVKGAFRQLNRITFAKEGAAPIPEDIRLLSDRVAAIRCQLNILTNTLNSCLDAMEKAETHLAAVQAAIDEAEEEDGDL